VNFLRGFTLELSNILDALGIKNIGELRGRRDLLYGDGLPKRILKILGIEGSVSNPPHKIRDVWSRRRISYLGELIAKGEPVIIGMSSTAPPEVEKPHMITDWLRIDGAQVIRPPIDPYIEDVEQGFYLAGGRLYVSSPIFFDVTNGD
jgi:hypothetical protein